jgi:hypothetical protein
MQRAALPCRRASNPIIRLSLLQRTSQKQALRARAQQPPHLYFADIAFQHVTQDASFPARRRPEVLDSAGIYGRRAVARLSSKPEHEAHSLCRKKRDLHAANEWRGLLGRGASRRTASSKVQRGRDQHERRGDLEVARDGNAHGLAQEAVVILERRGGAAARARAWCTPCTRGTPGEARHRSRPRSQRRPNGGACCTTRACCGQSRRTSARLVERAGSAGGQLQ